ncbi:hypothetical protein GE09DRAFT_1071934 [Coniochaeta sp. 2T2.1]|nr:hypothetical protein GE09DRAFT_1071934 [Coniochaeta sp. 2T2.1]
MGGSGISPEEEHISRMTVSPLRSLPGEDYVNNITSFSPSTATSTVRVDHRHPVRAKWTSSPLPHINLRLSPKIGCCKRMNSPLPRSPNSPKKTSCLPLPDVSTFPMSRVPLSHSAPQPLSSMYVPGSYVYSRDKRKLGQNCMPACPSLRGNGERGEGERNVCTRQDGSIKICFQGLCLHTSTVYSRPVSCLHTSSSPPQRGRVVPPVTMTTKMMMFAIVNYST